MNEIYCGNNLDVMSKQIQKESIDLIYLDPPFFGTGKQYQNLWNNPNEIDQYNERSKLGIEGYINWIEPRLYKMRELLKNTGNIYLHCDWHSNAHLRILMDEIFGLKNFQNEIIWHYNSGGSSKNNFSRKHDNILFYSKSNKVIFNHNDMRVPYKPQNTKIYHDDDGTYMIEPQTGKRRYYNEKGKVMDDVWDINFIGPNSKERLGYPTQKPETLLDRIIKASSNPGDIILDPFMGGGTTLSVANKLNRQFIGIDIAKEACDIASERVGYNESQIVNTIQIIPDFDIMKGHEFQEYVCKLLKVHNLSPDPMRPSGPDGGIDGIFTSGVYKGRLLSVTKTKISGAEIKDCIMDMAKNNFKKGVLVSSKPFSKIMNIRVEEFIEANPKVKDLELVYVGDLI